MTSLVEAERKFGHVVRDAGGAIFGIERAPSVGSKGKGADRAFRWGERGLECCSAGLAGLRGVALAARIGRGAAPGGLRVSR